MKGLGEPRVTASILLTTDSGDIRLWKCGDGSFDIEETPETGTLVNVSEKNMREIVHFLCREWRMI